MFFKPSLLVLCIFATASSLACRTGGSGGPDTEVPPSGPEVETDGDDLKLSCRTASNSIDELKNDPVSMALLTQLLVAPRDEKTPKILKYFSQPEETCE